MQEDFSKLTMTPEGQALKIFLEGVVASALMANDPHRVAWNVGQHDLAVEILEKLEGKKNG